MQRLGAAEDGRQGLQRHPNHVVLRLLGGEGHPGGLRVEPEHPRLGTLGAEALPHEERPEAPCRPEFCHLFKEVVVTGEEKGELGGKGIHIQTGLDRGLDVGHAIGEREAEFLGRRGPRLPDVIAADTDRMPAGHPFGAKGKKIGNEPHGGGRRKDVCPPGDVLFEDVVLHSPANLRRWDPLLFPDRHIHTQQNCGGGIDRHRRGDLVQGDAVQEAFHILQRIDDDSHLAHLSMGFGRIRVVPDLGREVEGNAQAGLALLQKIAKSAIGLLRRSEAGVLPHRPEAPPVHRGLNAPREGVFPGKAELRLVIPLAEIERSVEALHRNPRMRFKLILAFGGPLQRLSQRGFLPRPQHLFEFLAIFTRHHSSPRWPN